MISNLALWTGQGFFSESSTVMMRRSVTQIRKCRKQTTRNTLPVVHTVLEQETFIRPFRFRK